MSEQNIHDPSMDEILASIRRIISEDGGRELDAPGPSAVPIKLTKQDILDLTDVVLADGTVAKLDLARPTPRFTENPAPTRHEPSRSRNQHGAEDSDGLVSATDIITSMGDDELISEVTAAASVSMFSQLATLVERQELPPKPANAANGVRTLDSLVTELLRPLLREWLDRHLPHTIERLVRDEIERLVRRAGGR